MDPRDELETVHTAEDLAAIIAAGRQEGVIEEFASKLLAGAILFSERAAGEVMVPRPDIVALPITATPSDLERVVSERGLLSNTHIQRRHRQHRRIRPRQRPPLDR